MSAPNSKASPRSASTYGEGMAGSAAFDGGEDLLRSWDLGIRPDADLTVSQWADAHRMLGSRASAEPGRYRTARTPYMREIMDDYPPDCTFNRSTALIWVGRPFGV